MNHVQTRRGVFTYSVLRFLPLLISTGGTLLLAFNLGIHEFGSYSAALAMTQVITSIGLIGQEQLVLQGSLRMRTALLRAGITVLVTGLASGILGFLLLDPTLHFTVLPIVLSVCLIQFTSILFAFMLLWGHTQTRATSELGLRTAYQLGLNSGGAASGLASVTGFAGLAGSIAGSAVVVWMLARARSTRAAPAVPTVDAPVLRGAAFGLDGTLFSLGVTFPILVIAATQPEAINAQARIVLLCYTAIVSISRSFSGEIYRVHLYQATEPADRRALWGSLRKTLLGYGIAAAVALAAAGLLLPVILGPSYATAGVAILWLAGGALLQFAGYGMGALAVTNGFIRASILRNTITLAVSLTLSLLLDLGPVQLAWILILNDLITCVYFLLARRTWGTTVAKVPERTIP